MRVSSVIVEEAKLKVKADLAFVKAALAKSQSTKEQVKQKASRLRGKVEKVQADYEALIAEATE